MKWKNYNFLLSKTNFSNQMILSTNKKFNNLTKRMVDGWLRSYLEHEGELGGSP